MHAALRVRQGSEGVTNPATRPLVKSLMRVLSFLMGRRRKHVPKALRKNVLLLVLELLDLKNPTEVAVATYMTKNLICGNRAADEFLLDWEDVELVPAGDGMSTLPVLREMTQEEAGVAQSSMEEGVEEDEDEEAQHEEATMEMSAADEPRPSVAASDSPVTAALAAAHAAISAAQLMLATA